MGCARIIRCKHKRQARRACTLWLFPLPSITERLIFSRLVAPCAAHAAPSAPARRRPSGLGQEHRARRQAGGAGGHPVELLQRAGHGMLDERVLAPARAGHAAARGRAAEGAARHAAKAARHAGHAAHARHAAGAPGAHAAKRPCGRAHFGRLTWCALQHRPGHAADRRPRLLQARRHTVCARTSAPTKRGAEQVAERVPPARAACARRARRAPPPAPAPCRARGTAARGAGAPPRMSAKPCPPPKGLRPPKNCARRARPCEPGPRGR